MTAAWPDPSSLRRLAPLVFAALALAGCGPASSEAPAAAASTTAAQAVQTAQLPQDAQIRKRLAERVPALGAIDEVRASEFPGLFEVRFGGSEIIYTDASGEFIVQGPLIETKTMKNLTEARQDKLTAVDFASLPLKDAVQIKQGDGSRKLAVFVDPNCGYCKRLEHDLVALKDVTIYAFIIPILGPDSNAKARDIWCAKNNGQVWRAWMIGGATPPRVMGACDTTALERNLAFSQKYRIQGTPAIFFADGTRKSGAIPGAMIEKLLVAAAGQKG